MSDTQLANRPKNEIRAFLESDDRFKSEVARVLPKHLNAERFIRIAITATTRTPKLLECTPQSFFKCLLDLSALGLEPDGRRAHLIPYGRECTLVVDWKGLAELAMRSGIVSVLHADVVCENDAFEYNRGELKAHTVNYKEPRGKVYAVYALCRFKDGNEKCDVMSIDEVNAIRKRSRSGNNGPWVTDFNEMAKKTVFRRLSKWLPLSAEFRDALDKDGDVIEETAPVTTHAIGRIEKPVIDAEPFVLPGGDEEDSIPMGDAEHPSEAAVAMATTDTQQPTGEPTANDLVTTILAKAAKLDVGEKKLVKALIGMRLMEPAETLQTLDLAKLGRIDDAWETVAEGLGAAK